MYRFLLTCLILSLVYTYTTGCCNFDRQQINNRNASNENLKKTIQSFLDADEGIKNFCTNYSKFMPYIYYGEDGCVLKYYEIPPTVVNFRIIISKEKVLTTSVKRENKDRFEFIDMRVLPDILNFKQASGEFLKNTLKIVIPYNVPFNTEFLADCSGVPVNEKPKFDYRTSQDDN
ncbi:unnamed protein product [Euphydryas editha]|uniref:Uncharacterized protein n=1 Tax=Euphydryas editha TaxID=104508 RepID=A0AAU9UYW9_EUPED|nr:unnamed protein product [Euphydryas editha]